MDTIGKDSCGRRGGLIYSLTWSTRKTDKKWLWVIVLLVSLFQLIAPTVLLAGIAYLLVEKTGLVFSGQAVVISFPWFLVVVASCSPFVVTVFNPKASFRNTDQLISTAGDMNHIVKHSDNLFVKMLAKTIFVFSGVFAIYYALVIWFLYKNKLRALSVAELNLLGNALSGGKIFWGQARHVFHALSGRYACRYLEKGGAKQVAVSFAMGCKWILLDPEIHKDRKMFLIDSIRQVMKDYPDLPEEVTTRFREVVG